MTSNIGVGSKNITVGFGKSEGEEESNLMNSLNLYFKPEFLNRFDNIIEFKSLDRENLIQIANLMINELKTTLLENEITLMYRRKLKIKLQNLELIQGLEHVH